MLKEPSNITSSTRKELYELLDEFIESLIILLREDQILQERKNNPVIEFPMKPFGFYKKLDAVGLDVLSNAVQRQYTPKRPAIGGGPTEISDLNWVRGLLIRLKQKGHISISSPDDVSDQLLKMQQFAFSIRTDTESNQKNFHIRNRLRKKKKK